MGLGRRLTRLELLDPRRLLLVQTGLPTRRRPLDLPFQPETGGPFVHHSD